MKKLIYIVFQCYLKYGSRVDGIANFVLTLINVLAIVYPVQKLSYDIGIARAMVSDVIFVAII